MASLTLPRTRLLSAPRRVIVRDGFNRADSALTLGNAETGQAWSALVGTWGISSGKAYSASDSVANVAVIDAGISTVILEVTLRGEVVGPYRIPQALLRVIDSTNYLSVDVIGTGTRLYKNVGGVFTQLAAASPVGANDTDYRVKVVASGSTITVYVNGTFSLRHTLTGGDEATFGSATKWGIQMTKVSTPTIAARFDDFVVTAP